MKKFCLRMTLLVCAFISGSAVAQDRLYPGSGLMHDYNNALRQVFSDAYRFEVKARVLIQSKWGIEQMIAVEEIDETFYLSEIILRSSVWQDASEETVHVDPKTGRERGRSGRFNFSAVSTEIDRIERVEIEPFLAELIIDLWREMIMNSRYRANPIVSTGGVRYTYSMPMLGIGNAYAFVSNPQRGTDTHRFAELTEMIKNIIRAEEDDDRRQRLSKLELMALELEAILPNSAHMEKSSSYEDFCEQIQQSRSQR
ncbi:MAG: hypothetical protein ACXIUB_09110 [Wenzhouxiangella sp.]